MAQAELLALLPLGGFMSAGYLACDQFPGSPGVSHDGRTWPAAYRLCQLPGMLGSSAGWRPFAGRPGRWFRSHAGSSRRGDGHRVQSSCVVVLGCLLHWSGLGTAAWPAATVGEPTRNYRGGSRGRSLLFCHPCCVMTGSPGGGSAPREAAAGAESPVARVGQDVLVGRSADCRALDDLVGAVRLGLSRALVIAGEAGIGKTRLLRYTAQAAGGLRTVSIAGVGSELRLGFAALHRMLVPFL